MNTLTSTGSVPDKDFQKLHLESTRKQNKLLDLEIERKKVELEITKVQLEEMKNKN